MFKEPDEIPLMWIGLLFSLLGFGSFFYSMAGEELPSLPEQFSSMWEMCGVFRDRTAQCLVGVNYLRPRRYTIETLVFYYALEKFRARNTEFGTYILLGIVIRVAMRLGYHRDASHFPSISPFDGEMRRRVWCMIYHLDLLNSAQVGLPRMIRDAETDTAEPKNLLDNDFDEDITEVPHPRPSTEVTVVAFAIFQFRLTRHLGLIVDQINSITPPSYDEVMALDLKLFDTHATLPPYLTMRPLSLSITDDARIILRRFAIEAYFQKSRCLLHRKYLIPGKTTPRFRYSRTTSVNAALKLLDLQYIVYEATRPGGQLFSEQWRTSALLIQDYVLAAMIISLDLAWGTRMKTAPTNCEDEITPMWPTIRRVKTLKSSYDIWCKSTTTSALAAKAAEALKGMLKDLESSGLTETMSTTLAPNATNVSCMPPPALALKSHDTDLSLVDETIASQLPTYIDQTHPEAYDQLDFNVPYFEGSSTTDFLTGMADTDMNFDWISSHGSKLSKATLPSKAAFTFCPWSSLSLSHLSSPASPFLASATTYPS
jgi:hypothetical protein